MSENRAFLGRGVMAAALANTKQRIGGVVASARRIHAALMSPGFRGADVATGL
ncbi:hypothetical protein AB0F17_35535 [Nonomuraea sp. NPDC026600]|uniref:hypothetical protein n=1 Tax=Nonomuraea sp. NPDC026600 TaxID=3155363 RepID=UPI0033E26077